MSRASERLERTLKGFIEGLEKQVRAEPLPPLPVPEEKEPDTWELRVSYKRLMRLVMMISHYRAKGEFTETGNMLDDYAVTEDEEDIVGYAVERAMDDVWMKLARMGKEVEDAFSYSPVGELWVMRFEMLPNYDRNIFGILSDAVESFVVWKVLADWWKIKGYDRGAQMALMQFDEAESRLLSCVHWRKKCIQRPGSVF